MAMLDQIGQDKQRISERLVRLDAERTKLSDQLDELEIAERALKRFGGKGVVAEKRKRRRAAKPATAAGAGAESGRWPTRAKCILRRGNFESRASARQGRQCR